MSTIPPQPQAVPHSQRRVKIPFLKRPMVRNAMVVLPIAAFTWAVARHAGDQVGSDFTKDPLYPEVLAELKREELMQQTKQLSDQLSSK